MDIRDWAWWQKWLALTGLLWIAAWAIVFFVLGGPVPDPSWTRWALRQVIGTAVISVSAAIFLGVIAMGRLWVAAFQEFRAAARPLLHRAQRVWKLRR